MLFDIEALTTRELRALSRLNDSKQHTIEVREELFPIVLRTAAEGLRRLALRARRSTRAACTRRTSPRCATRCWASRGPGCICLSDGFAVGDIGHEQRAIVEGDATSAAIAAASIVAKVTRDRYMHRADALHPGWEFAAHVGYSTPEHREAIQRLGVSPLHRLSFQSTAYQQLAL